jgi:hypothetical protein
MDLSDENRVVADFSQYSNILNINDTLIFFATQLILAKGSLKLFDSLVVYPFF